MQQHYTTHKKKHGEKINEPVRPRTNLTLPDQNIPQERLVGANNQKIQKKEITMIISDSKSNLFSALIKARTEIDAVVKDKEGYGYKYATLDNVISMLKGVLPKFGLGYAQFPETTDGKDGVTTIVMHESGEYMLARYEMEATEVKGTNLTQQKGASITYTRRYALCSVFGIPTEEDTDGTVSTPNRPARHVEPEKSSVEDVIKGMEQMTKETTKKFYAKAIELYGKETPEYKQWIKVWADKKEALEKQAAKEDLKSELDALDQYYS